MALPPDLLFGMIVPVVVGTISWGLAFPFFKPDRRYLWLLPLGLFLPFIFAVAGLREIPAFPPINADGLLFYFAILALLLSLIPSQKFTNGALSGYLAMVCGVLVGVVNVYPLFKSEAFTLNQAFIHAAAISALTTLFVWLLLRVGSNGVRIYIWLCMLLGVGASVLLILSGSAYLGLLVGTLGAVFGPAVFLSIFVRRDAVITAPLMLGFGLLLSASLAQGYLYASTPLESALLFAAAPGIAARQYSGNRGFVAGACFVALALLLAAIRYFGIS